MPVLFGRLCVAPILIQLTESHPRMELDLSFSDRLIDVMEDGFHLVVRNGALRTWPSLTAHRIAHKPMRVCAAPAYLEAAGTPTSVVDLVGHRAILDGRGGDLRP